MRYFGDDPLRGFLYYFVGTLFLWYLIRWFYHRRSQVTGTTSPLSRNLYIIGLVISPIFAYQLINIDEKYGYYRYFKAACNRDGGDYVAARLEKIESIAVHPIGLAFRSSGEIKDYARYYLKNNVGQKFSFVEFQFDTATLRDAENAEAFYREQKTYRLTLDGKPVDAGFYRVENLCRSGAPFAWRTMESSCYRVQKVNGLESPYVVEHQMEQCDTYSGLFRLCSIKWHLIQRKNNTLIGRSIMYAYSGGWRNKEIYPANPKSPGDARPFEFCGSYSADIPYGNMDEILIKANKNEY